MKSECSGCNLTFTSVSAFDMHRVGGWGDPIYATNAKGKRGDTIGYTKPTRRCLTEQEMLEKGMRKTEKGWWSTGTFDTNYRAQDEETEPDEGKEVAD